MPITCDIDFTPVSQEEFQKIDYRVSGLSFQSQNELGGVLKEEAYRRVLIQRLCADGFGALDEVKINISHGTFSRNCFCDLVVDGKVVYELKAVQAISGYHQEQLLHYLFLTGLRHGKIMNFRGQSVAGYYVSTHYTQAERRQVSWDFSDWRGASKDSGLIALFQNLIEDWGTGLHLKLYEDALIYLSRGRLLRTEVAVTHLDLYLSSETWPVYDRERLFHLSSVTRHVSAYEKQLQKFLRLTNRTHLDWINLNRRQITCKTLKN